MPSVFLLRSDVVFKCGDETTILKKGSRISNSDPLFLSINASLLQSLGEVQEPIAEPKLVEIATVYEESEATEPAPEKKKRKRRVKLDGV